MICSISRYQIRLNNPGHCEITASQTGSQFVEKALLKNFSFDVIGENVISISTPMNDAKISDQPFTYLVTASSGLEVKSEVLTPGICSLEGDKIRYTHIGLCQIRWSQPGNIYYSTADPVLTSFKINQTNQINFAMDPSYKISLKAINLTGTSTSLLPVSYQSLTPLICGVSQEQVELLNPGQCTISATQDGTDFVDMALPLVISFNVIGANDITFYLPNTLLLGLNNYPLTGTSSAGVAVNYFSLTPEICSINNNTLVLNKLGACTVDASQSGSNYYEAAKSVELSTNIVSSRVTADQPDIATGFQVKAIYVVPADGTDNSYDTNGYIGNILDEANSYLNEQLGLQLPIDKTKQGYDIQFLRSKITSAEFMHSTNLLERLLGELGAMDNPGINRKNYIFFVDVPTLVDGMACGYSHQPGMVSLIAIGTTCTLPKQTFQNFASKSLVHEIFHNFGVGHFNDGCDLMNNPLNCGLNQRPTIDKERQRYVGASAFGVGDSVLSPDILKLNVWQGHTNQVGVPSNCILDPGARSDGFHYAYCPIGSQSIGALSYCYSSVTSSSLEELIGANWISLGAGSSSNQPWGISIKWKCDNSSVAPWKQVTVSAPGVHHYRWIVNGTPFEEFNIIWAQ